MALPAGDESAGRGLAGPRRAGPPGGSEAGAQGRTFQDEIQEKLCATPRPDFRPLRPLPPRSAHRSAPATTTHLRTPTLPTPYPHATHTLPAPRVVRYYPGLGVKSVETRLVSALRAAAPRAARQVPSPCLPSGFVEAKPEPGKAPLAGTGDYAACRPLVQEAMRARADRQQHPPDTPSLSQSFLSPMPDTPLSLLTAAAAVPPPRSPPSFPPTATGAAAGARGGGHGAARGGARGGVPGALLMIFTSYCVSLFALFPWWRRGASGRGVGYNCSSAAPVVVALWETSRPTPSAPPAPSAERQCLLPLNSRPQGTSTLHHVAKLIVRRAHLPFAPLLVSPLCQLDQTARTAAMMCLGRRLTRRCFHPRPRPRPRRTAADPVRVPHGPLPRRAGLRRRRPLRHPVGEIPGAREHNSRKPEVHPPIPTIYPPTYPPRAPLLVNQPRVRRVRQGWAALDPDTPLSRLAGRCFDGALVVEILSADPGLGFAPDSRNVGRAPHSLYQSQRVKQTLRVLLVHLCCPDVHG